MLFLVRADPASSGRVAEAVRMAAGIAAWQGTKVSICFGGAARSVLKGPDGSWVDGEQLERCLSMLAELGVTVHALFEDRRESVLDPDWSGAAIEETDVPGLARLMLQAAVVLEF